MKKAFFRIMVVFAVAILSAAPSLADNFSVGDTITFTLSNAVSTPFGSGGLFTITDTSGGVVQSFCLELNEHIYQNDLVGSISSAAVAGGRGGGSPDPISSSTDWLYAQYIGGSATYNSPQALQIAFWILENEMTLAEAADWVTKGYFSQALLDLANAYIAAAPPAGTYGTQVLNLTDAAGNPHQSQLFHSVPEPGILILLGIAMSAVGIASRYVRKI